MHSITFLLTLSAARACLGATAALPVDVLFRVDFTKEGFSKGGGCNIPGREVLQGLIDDSYDLFKLGSDMLARAETLRSAQAIYRAFWHPGDQSPDETWVTDVMDKMVAFLEGRDSDFLGDNKPYLFCDDSWRLNIIPTGNNGEMMLLTLDSPAWTDEGPGHPKLDDEGNVMTIRQVYKDFPLIMKPGSTPFWSPVVKAYFFAIIDRGFGGMCNENTLGFTSHTQTGKFAITLCPQSYGGETTRLLAPDPATIEAGDLTKLVGDPPAPDFTKAAMLGEFLGNFAAGTLAHELVHMCHGLDQTIDTTYQVFHMLHRDTKLSDMLFNPETYVAACTAWWLTSHMTAGFNVDAGTFTGNIYEFYTGFASTRPLPKSGNDFI